MAPQPQIERFRELLSLCAQLNGDAPTLEDLRRPPWPTERRALPEVRDLKVDGPGGPISVRLYRPEPPSRGPLPVLVYLHGGGWVVGGIEHVDEVCRELAVGAGCAVVSVGYRLAPEHPFPAAVEDAWAVLSDLTSDPERYGADPGAVAVAGESAGGNLAAVTALRARDEGVPLVHQLLVYPVTDAAMDTPSWSEYASGFGLDGAMMAAFLGMYRGDADADDPRLSPLRARDLAGAAPATVITAGCDILRDEGEAYARRLAEAGVPVELRRFDDAVHSFFLLPEIFDAGRDARAMAVRALRAAFDSTAVVENAPR
ncbi:alpha/beta hydrolase [Thermomonospora umbrina]|uniref:Acetyl esterase n=1 Tax=Thermomonospora umbrina TaxID=111806 RepID=A0A3D9SX70_9ACTN|nr:alpha/beta hydrolase [Thermomonospora umbrina]REF00168.1 acetyl esterase [Thermomonospora umbrina]